MQERALAFAQEFRPERIATQLAELYQPIVP
jgi:hypothetical protein